MVPFEKGIRSYFFLPKPKKEKALRFEQVFSVENPNTKKSFMEGGRVSCFFVKNLSPVVGNVASTITSYHIFVHNNLRRRTIVTLS